jgi:hypothetical protein
MVRACLPDEAGLHREPSYLPYALEINVNFTDPKFSISASTSISASVSPGAAILLSKFFNKLLNFLVGDGVFTALIVDG